MSISFYDYIVVGSSFSAFPAIQELIKRKKNFAVFDVGKKISKKISKKFYDLSWQEIKSNKNLLLKDINKLQNKSNLKLSYGSNYPYKSKIYDYKKFQHLISNALGGFSNNWGSVLSLYPKESIQEWGIKYEDFVENLDDALGILGLDKSVKKKLIEDNNYLEKNFKISKSILSVTNECKLRNVCLYGCPERSIFNFQNKILELISKKKIIYKNELEIKTISTASTGIQLTCLNNKNEEKKYFCKKVFLGTGAASTSKIILESFSGLDKLELKDSSMFFFPIFFLKEKENNKRGNQLCSKIFKYKKKSFDFTIQIYERIDFFLNRLPMPFKYFANLFNLGIGIGYLNCDSSSKLIIQKKNQKLNYKLIKKFNLIQRLKSQLIFFYEGLKNFEWFCFPFFNISFKPFTSFHYGSSLSMKSGINKKYYTNINGEFANCKNIILLDASTFPKIKSGSISLMILLNSYRIVKKILKND